MRGRGKWLVFGAASERIGHGRAGVGRLGQASGGCGFKEMGRFWQALGHVNWALTQLSI